MTVAVVNWNGRHHLQDCLPALSRQTYPDFEIVVVDNASTDGSEKWLAEDWPDVRVIGAGGNVGFARANNLAIGATDTPWIALLNNDTVPDPDWLAALVEAAAADADIGSVASLMLFLDDPGTVNSAGIAIDPAGIAWDRLGGAPETAASEPLDVFGASAGAALYRRAALLDMSHEVDGDGGDEAGDDRGGNARDDADDAGFSGEGLEPPAVFDERFFMYLEDVDLAWRLQLRGWRSTYAPGARVLHRGSATAGEGSPFKNRLLARNKIWTVAKNYPSGPLLAWLPIVLLYDLASAPYRIVAQGQTAALSGRVDALRGLRYALAQRRQVQGRRTASWSDIARTFEPLAAPWAVPSRYRHLAPRQ